MSAKPVFPISVKFEDGTIETYNDVEELETNLEVFDSEVASACEVKDYHGRPVRLRVSENLVLKELSLVDEG